ncbi:MAG TPA: Fic family protein [Steroidobacteraceae bacterium]|jgi:Fic family protein|nr:Fic family protein [Steroidobacteraceae bacterium]
MAVKRLKSWIWQRHDWPEFGWDTARLARQLAAARRAQGELDGTARLLDSDADVRALLEVLTSEGVATSAIEGERFDPNALRSSLARRLGLPTQGLPAPTRSIEGLADVLLAAPRSPGEPLTLETLADWQAALFPTGRSGLAKIRVGGLRGTSPMRIVSGPIERERVHYEAPPRRGLEREVDRFLAWFNSPPAELDGLLRAGLAHAWFEIIHPFEDGNGRVGRALLDRALAQDRAGHSQGSSRLYSLSARFMAVRDEYYAELEALSRGSMDATDWLQWFLEQVVAACEASSDTVERVVHKTRFWMRHGRSDLNERQRKALDALLDAEPGGFVGGMTNKKYAHLNHVSPATAQRDLAELTGQGILRTRGGGRSLRYELSA